MGIFFLKLIESGLHSQTRMMGFFNSFENDHMNFIFVSSPSLLSSYCSIIVMHETLMFHVRSMSVIAAVPRPSQTELTMA